LQLWGFLLCKKQSWWVENPESVAYPKEMMPLPPELASAITGAQLMFEPFFELRVDELVSNDPNDPSPSDFGKIGDRPQFVCERIGLVVVFMLNDMGWNSL